MSVEFQGIKIIDAILVFKNKGGLRFLILFFLISKKNLGGGGLWRKMVLVKT
jgi:hypothetical protein